MAVYYVGSTKYSAIAQWAASTAYTVGQLVRQLAAPAVGSERVFMCVVAGTSGGSEPSFTLTQNARTTDNTVTWQEYTGQAAQNGDITNTTAWAASVARALGKVISNVAKTHYFLCTAAGTSKSGAEPSWNTTTGATTTDGTATFTCIGSSSFFAPYAAAAARLDLSFVTAGDIVYVSNNHNETRAAAVTLTFGSTGNPIVHYICVDDAVVPPTTEASTAVFATTGASNITLFTIGLFKGITFSAGDGSNQASVIVTIGLLENCTLKLNNTHASSRITLGNGKAKNCNMVFGATTQSCTRVNYEFVWEGGTIAATGSIPATFISQGTGTFRGVDMSALTGNIQTASDVSSGLSNILNCKLNSSSAMPGPSSTYFAHSKIRYHLSDNAAANYRTKYIEYGGTVTNEMSIVRTGGASDGTNQFAWLMTSSSFARYGYPLISEDIVVRNETTGSSMTATVELTTDATLTDKDCWLEVEYLDDSGSPKTSIVTTRGNFLASAGNALTTSSSTWGGTAKTNKYKIAASFTPQMKGPIKVRVCLALASTTIYVDPLVTLA